jgi:hypothetical protein
MKHHHTLTAHGHTRPLNRMRWFIAIVSKEEQETKRFSHEGRWLTPAINSQKRAMMTGNEP